MIREDGRVAITDFGLARETGTGSMTESGSIVGTPMYMPPEQVLGDREVLGTRADVYGLGATLYHLLTGRPPFSGPTAQAVLKDVLEREPESPRRLRSELPRDSRRSCPWQWPRSLRAATGRPTTWRRIWIASSPANGSGPSSPG